MFKRFFIYGIFGWGIEIIWTGMHSLLVGDIVMQGYTNIWMFFIYGCAIFLEPLHDIIRNWRWQIRGVLWVIIIWGIEYTSGIILLNILGSYPWYYSSPYAVDNLVRIDYGPAWFLAGMIFERIHQTLDLYKVA
ncbi:UNVERIFIED_CONTAM: putative ABC-transporter type IV [Acetivibrio alkalicellulosi]